MIDRREVVVILLAAGLSSRFGDQDKLLAPLNDVALVLHAARTIVKLGAGRKIAVCGKERVARQLRPLGFEIAFNADAEQGLSTSLATGIAAVASDDCRAALICLGDMPFVTASHLQRLMARFDPVDAPTVASSKDGVPMPPALFSRSYFEKLRAGRGDRGAKALLGSAALICATGNELADIDTIDDLERVTP